MGPSCVICRTRLCASTPIIPNLAVDNAVEKCIEALRTNGIDEWEITGIKFIEWQTRKE